MVLKTNSEVHYHGADGVYGKYDTETQKYCLYWGEAKIYADVRQALSSCFDSIKTLLTEEGVDGTRKERDMDLFRTNLDFDNPEINILKTYNRIDLNSAVESRLLALAQNDSIFDARVLHVNKNKLNHWVLSLLNAKYGDKAILFLSKLLPKKEKWNNMYTIYSYMQLIENLMKA